MPDSVVAMALADAAAAAVTSAGHYGAPEWSAHFQARACAATEP